MKLSSCSGCSRHVKQEVGECPFCGAPTRSTVDAIGQKRAVRAAMLAAAVGVACGGIIEPSPSDASADAAKDTGAVVVPYGVPPFDAAPGPDASTIADTSTHDVTIAPPYGTPPPPPHDP